MGDESIEITEIDWAVNIKPISGGRVEGTVNALKANFLVLIHELPDRPYVSISVDKGRSWTDIPNNRAHSVTAALPRWRIDAPAESAPGKGVWLLVEAIREAGSQSPA